MTHLQDPADSCCHVLVYLLKFGQNYRQDSLQMRAINIPGFDDLVTHQQWHEASAQREVPICELSLCHQKFVSSLPSLPRQNPLSRRSEQLWPSAASQRRVQLHFNIALHEIELSQSQWSQHGTYRVIKIDGNVLAAVWPVGVRVSKRGTAGTHPGLGQGGQDDIVGKA